MLALPWMHLWRIASHRSAFIIFMEGKPSMHRHAAFCQECWRRLKNVVGQIVALCVCQGATLLNRHVVRMPYVNNRRAPWHLGRAHLRFSPDSPRPGQALCLNQLQQNVKVGDVHASAGRQQQHLKGDQRVSMLSDSTCENTGENRAATLTSLL